MTDCFLLLVKKCRVPCSIRTKPVLLIYATYSLLGSFPSLQAQMRNAGAPEYCCS